MSRRGKGVKELFYAVLMKWTSQFMLAEKHALKYRCGHCEKYDVNIQTQCRMVYGHVL